jgi:hypothetical protein
MHQKIEHRSPISNEDLKELLAGLEERRDASLNNLTCRTLIEEVLYLRQINDGIIPETQAVRGIRSLLRIIGDAQDEYDELLEAYNSTSGRLAAAEAFIKDATPVGVFGKVDETVKA